MPPAMSNSKGLTKRSVDVNRCPTSPATAPRPNNPGDVPIPNPEINIATCQYAGSVAEAISAVIVSPHGNNPLSEPRPNNVAIESLFRSRDERLAEVLVIHVVYPDGNMLR